MLRDLLHELGLFEQRCVGDASRVRTDVVVELVLERGGFGKRIKVVPRRREAIGHVAHDIRGVAKDAPVVGTEHGRRKARRSRVGTPEPPAMDAIDRGDMKKRQNPPIAVRNGEPAKAPARLFDVVRKRDTRKLVHGPVYRTLARAGSGSARFFSIRF